jgi:hypothetical protein
MDRPRTLLAAAFAALTVSPVLAQDHMAGKVEIPFNRYSTFAQIEDYLHDLARAYPDLIELRSIGKSGQGREMWLAIINSPKTGPHESKPAMWIDGNIHANEIQGAETVLYSIWYLTKAYGVNEDLTELLDSYSFYMLPVVNPDSREYFFEQEGTPHFPRWNQRPVDNDRDGLVDEDGPDDLDGDGSITQMWVEDPAGRWRRDPDDPRVFTRVGPDEQGGWTRLGQEGVDNDGDGRTNEDGPGGDDLNRNWPGDWKPNYVQYGAGTYPFSNPETRAIGQWVYDHPNIAAFQSYHNSGGMILRGPGASYLASRYPARDRRVYDEIGRIGEQLLPYYNYLVINEDLYDVHGGEATWAAESLGIISFTNELWTAGKYFQRDQERPTDEQMWLFRDRLQFGQAYKELTEYDHPEHGKVLIGGLNKYAARNTPTFMLEEECHRNFAFTMYHADQMPVLSFPRVEVTHEGGRLWSVTVEVRNEKLIPTRTAIARDRGIGAHDLLTLEGARVVTSGTLSNWRDTAIGEVRHEPERVQFPGGVAGQSSLVHRFYVEGDRGDEVVIRYVADKAADIETRVTLETD